MEKETRLDYLYIGRLFNYNKSDSIPMDELDKAIEGAKERGANEVELDYDFDDDGDVETVDIIFYHRRMETDEELEERKRRVETFKSYTQIAEYESQIALIKAKIDRIKSNL